MINFLIIIVLMAFSAFFSGSETAFSALNKVQIFRIRSEKSKNAGFILQFIDNPSKLFITVLLGNVLVNLSFISITSSFIFNRIFHGKNLAVASVTAVSVELVILLLFGEITPKSFALRNAERVARFSARPLYFFSQCILPVRGVLRIVTDFCLSLIGIRTVGTQQELSSEEMKEKIRHAGKTGAINAQEEGIITNIFDLCNIEADEAMIPRNKIICLKVTQTLKDAFATAKDRRYSRLPVYRGGIDSICGVFTIKDYLKWEGKAAGEGTDMKVEDMTIEEFISRRDMLEKIYPGNENSLIRLPVFAFEKCSVGQLIRDLTGRKRRMAILLDEHGGVAGLITVKDIIDEVLKDLLEKDNIIDGYPVVHDPKDASILILPGMVSLRSMRKKYHLCPVQTKADTIGGYIFELAGYIPETGGTFVDKTDNILYTVESMDGNRIAIVKVQLRTNE